jgi:putative Holliday junction resolvase
MTAPSAPQASAKDLPALAVPAHFHSFMAFDFGLRRTGVAVGNRITLSAQALTAVHASGDARWLSIMKLVNEWQADALVVGVPYHPDGAAHENTARARQFAQQLRGRSGRIVFEVDERYSTVEAQANLAAEGQSKGSRAARGGSKGQDIDARSAQVILQQFLLGL